MYKKVSYDEIARAKLSPVRNIVISNCSQGGFTMAQQLAVVDGDKIGSVFLKGAIHIDDINGLTELRDALTLAIDAATTQQEAKEKDKIEWDY